MCCMAHNSVILPIFKFAWGGKFLARKVKLRFPWKVNPNFGIKNLNSVQIQKNQPQHNFLFLFMYIIHTFHWKCNLEGNFLIGIKII